MILFISMGVCARIWPEAMPSVAVVGVSGRMCACVAQFGRNGLAVSGCEVVWCGVVPAACSGPTVAVIGSIRLHAARTIVSTSTMRQTRSPAQSTMIIIS